MKIKILMNFSTFENFAICGETVRKFPRTTKNDAKNFKIKVKITYFLWWGNINSLLVEISGSETYAFEIIQRTNVAVNGVICDAV